MDAFVLISPRIAAGLAAAAAAALLATAFAFQHLGGLHPCALCIYQRWPYLALAALGAAAIVWGTQARPLLALGAGVCLVGAGIAAVHVGVQQGWWAGLPGCAGPDIQGLSVEALRAQLLATPVARCDSIDWRFIGLSMPVWNLIASLALAVLCGAAALRRRTAPA